jgi:hypothetical protein
LSYFIHIRKEIPELNGLHHFLTEDKDGIPSLDLFAKKATDDFNQVDNFTIFSH